MAKAKLLPRNGSDEESLASCLNNVAVWKCLILHSTFKDDFDDREVARRISAAVAGSGVEVTADDVNRLYWLAVERARKDTAAKKAA
jgi:hypothetical protein